MPLADPLAAAEVPTDDPATGDEPAAADVDVDEPVVAVDPHAVSTVRAAAV